jgi:hypothetical protein
MEQAWRHAYVNNRLHNPTRLYYFVINVALFDLLILCAEKLHPSTSTTAALVAKIDCQPSIRTDFNAARQTQTTLYIGSTESASTYCSVF